MFLFYIERHYWKFALQLNLGLIPIINIYCILILSDLKDFEALQPNLLARTIETVEGGGVVVLLLRSVSSLKQLYTMTMDVHERFRTEAHKEVVARFNERLVLLAIHWTLWHPMCFANKCKLSWSWKQVNTFMTHKLWGAYQYSF